MKKVREARALALELDCAGEGDGSQLGVLESELCAKALRSYARRRAAGRAALVAAPFALAAVAAFGDLDEDGNVSLSDAKAALRMVTSGSKTRFERRVELNGVIYRAVFEDTRGRNGVDRRIVSMTPVTALAILE